MGSVIAVSFYAGRRQGPPPVGDTATSIGTKGMDDHDRRFARPGDGPSWPPFQLPGCSDRPVGKGLSAWRVLGPMAEATTSFGAMFPQAGRPAPSADGGPAGVSKVADMSPAIAQADQWPPQARCATGVLWPSCTRVYQSSLMQVVADRAAEQAAVSPADCRLLADELRAFLRETGDAAVREDRRLQHELEQISESIAQVADQLTRRPIIIRVIKSGRIVDGIT